MTNFPATELQAVKLRPLRYRVRCLMAAFCVYSLGSAADHRTVASLNVLKQMTLDELMNVEVTSVSKSPERYASAAAALTVVTDEHIRRSGATNVPDALRWVPGLHVARQSSSVWALASRGFSSVSSEKLLVQSDSRSIYTPLFSGVLWDVQDYLMADIERIEVIRGPGAALWGSNAVNGVINITTKNAANTHGTLVETSVGTEEAGMIAARHGGQTSGGIHYRVFGKYVDRDRMRSVGASSDDWRLGHVGFRADWSPTTQDELTLQADAYRGEVGQLAPAISIIGRPDPVGDLEAQVGGGNLLGRWRHFFENGSDLQLRAYYDRTHRDDPSFTDDLETFDVDVQHRFSPSSRHEVIWGFNHRHTWNHNDGKGIFAVRPEHSRDQLFSAFGQDQIDLLDTLRVTVGTKAEHNEFSGFELQPSVRAAWELSPTQMVWAAISRAARIPTRLERDIFIDVTDPQSNPVVRLLGNSGFDSEELIAYELGYRWRASDMLHIDLAVFENQYDGLSSLEIGDPFADAEGRTVVPIVNKNLTDGSAHGAETLVTFTPISSWRLSASYSYLNLKIDPAGQDLNRGLYYDGATPQHQFALSSYLDLPGNFEMDAHFRRLGALRRLPESQTGEGVPAYSELDVQLSWRASDQFRMSVVGQNLLHREHVEFGTPPRQGVIRRGVYAKAVLEF